MRNIESLLDNHLIFNGVDVDSGRCAKIPEDLAGFAKGLRLALQGQPAVPAGRLLQNLTLPPGLDPESLPDVGWGLVCPAGQKDVFSQALEPLVAHRTRQATPARIKVLEYQPGEDLRTWYQRHQVDVANFDPDAVPYYLLLAGPLQTLPLEFQYQLAAEYAVGRVCFDALQDYARYAQSVVDYETATLAYNEKEIVFWGPRHLADPATYLSTTCLLDPLSDGVATSVGPVRLPAYTRLGYRRQKLSVAAATKDQLLAQLRRELPPALVFTASHGATHPSGHSRQRHEQGALLCQDWPGYGNPAGRHLVAAADIDDACCVRGMVAFFFACFSAGSPTADSLEWHNRPDWAAQPLAPEPFIAALPQRLLAHPKGGALAVIGHIDRATGFSIRPPTATRGQIAPFENTLSGILSGKRIGRVLGTQFCLKWALLSTQLLAAVAGNAPPHARLADDELVRRWLERNDAQNYVLLGDPAARIAPGHLH